MTKHISTKSQRADKEKELREELKPVTELSPGLWNWLVGAVDRAKAKYPAPQGKPQDKPCTCVFSRLETYYKDKEPTYTTWMREDGTECPIHGKHGVGILAPGKEGGTPTPHLGSDCKYVAP